MPGKGRRAAGVGLRGTMPPCPQSPAVILSWAAAAALTRGRRTGWDGMGSKAGQWPGLVTPAATFTFTPLRIGTQTVVGGPPRVLCAAAVDAGLPRVSHSRDHRGLMNLAMLVKRNASAQ